MKSSARPRMVSCGFTNGTSSEEWVTRVTGLLLYTGDESLESLYLEALRSCLLVAVGTAAGSLYAPSIEGRIVDTWASEYASASFLPQSPFCNRQHCTLLPRIQIYTPACLEHCISSITSNFCRKFVTTFMYNKTKGGGCLSVTCHHCQATTKK